MGQGLSNNKYLVIIRDDLSSYIWLWPTEDTTTASAAEVLCVWIGVFGAMHWLVSDQGSHFKNRLISEFSDELQTKHHLMTAYSPCANGSVERIFREVIRAYKALLSKWKLGAKDWPSAAEAVQSVINHAPSKRLGLRSADVAGVYRTPLEVFPGHEPVRPLIRALPIQKYRSSLITDEIRARTLLGVENLQQVLHNMHKYVQTVSSASRKPQVERHNRRTNFQTARFARGDFVLVRRAQPADLKLHFV